MIRTIFEIAIREIEIPGTKVVGFPLFSVMDGACSCASIFWERTS